MTLLPEIHEELRRAVRYRRRRRLTRVGFAASLVIVASGTAVAATGTWRPQLGSPDRGPVPKASSRSVPASQRDLLAVLRRPQSERDRGPLVEAALKVLSREVVNGIHTDAIRVLFQNAREVVLLVPVRRVGVVDHPENVQRDQLCLMSATYTKGRTVRFRQKGRTRVERIPAGYAGWGSHCGDLKRLRKTGIQAGTSPEDYGGVITSATEMNRTRTRWTVLVPDGVARVTVRVRGGKTVTGTVHDNVYQYTITGPGANLGSTWYDAKGNRIPGR
jgi:hypothetical protein